MSKARLTASVGLVLLATLGVCAATLAAVGRTSGSFVISSTGAATYTIPIWAPPGPRGLQPNLALIYNHLDGGGSLGRGWQLAGLSGISRCNRTFAQDGTPSAVTLTYSDAFCLDGKRLRLTSVSSYGQDGSTYQTEIAEFSNVAAHGIAGNGPAYFTVQGKDGLIYEYGNGRYSQVLASGTPTASAWLLDKVTDRAGNTMVVTYTAPGATLTGTTVPASISWTPTSAGAQTYTYTMTFNYTNNVPQSSFLGYVAGTSIVNTDLLLNISIANSSGATIKLYKLNYEISPTTSEYRLNQVTECADSAQTNCLLPTAITYQNGGYGTSTVPTTGISTAIGTSYAPPTLIAKYDFNGDGIRDLAFLQNGTWWVAFGSPGGYGTPFNTGIVGVDAPIGWDILFGDLLGTGQDGILARNGSASAAWTYYTWNSAAFVSSPTGLAFDTSQTSVQLADVNGDGLPDFVTLNFSNNGSSGTAQIYTRLNTSSSGVVSFSAPISAYTYTDPGLTAAGLRSPDWGFGPWRTFDFNGDGRQDLALVTNVCTSWYVTQCISYQETASALLAQSGGTFTASALVSAVGYSGSDILGYVAFTKWNDDGCTDVVQGNHVLISPCAGSPSSTITLAHSQMVTMMDWDGDGRTDLITRDSSSGPLYAELSTGSGIASPIPLSLSLPPSSCIFTTVDADGDGLDDLGCATTSAPGFVYYLHNSAGRPPDLLASVTDGYGNSVAPSYVPIDWGRYTKWSGATYPEQDVASSRYVVSQVAASDGVGGTYTQGYSYAGARQNRQGYGFEGFTSITVNDSRVNSLVHTTTYQTAFPYTGMISQADTFQNDGKTLVSHVTYTNSKIDLDITANNQRRFVYVQASNVQDYEVGGPKNGLPITTTATGYAFDSSSYGNARNISVTVTDNDSTSPYAGQQWTTTTATIISPDSSANWCLTQPTQIAVTRTSPGSSITRTVSFTPDYVNCRPTARTIEPNSPAYALTESYSYDSFGNVSDVNVSGVGVPLRKTHVNWGATGQFPMSVTNPLNQTAQYNYDLNLGFRTSAIDPNLVSVSWADDAFGRKIRETRPDGTYTVWGYNDCGSGCLGSHSLALTRTVYNTDSTVQTDGTTYFDQLDRPLIDNKRMLAANTYDRNEVHYDNFGRIASQAIPCTWSAVGTACPYWTTNTFDALGRVIQTQRPINATNTLPQTTSIQYAGRTVTTTDPQGVQTVKTMAVSGTMGKSQDNAGYYQNFTYDSFGSLVSVTDSLYNTLFTASYDYGIGAFQRDATDADLDISTALGQHRHYSYDALGELTSWTDAKGQSFSQTYDLLSRPLVRTEPDMTTSWTWGATPTSFNVGKLQSVSANSYSESFTYDSAGRQASRTVTIPSDQIYAYELSYSATTGLLDTLTYPVSTSSYRLKLQYTYQNGILQKVSDFNSPTAYWLANSTNARGQVIQETLGNNVVTNRSFDAVTGWINGMTSSISGTTALQNDAYLFDKVGNLSQRQNINTGVTENFFYDKVYRLDHSTLGGTINLQMYYDAMGNITSRSASQEVLSGPTIRIGSTPRRKRVAPPTAIPMTPTVTSPRAMGIR